jgi:hypothetical protein
MLTLGLRANSLSEKDGLVCSKPHRERGLGKLRLCALDEEPVVREWNIDNMLEIACITQADAWTE